MQFLSEVIVRTSHNLVFLQKRTFVELNKIRKQEFRDDLHNFIVNLSSLALNKGNNHLVLKHTQVL